MRLILAVLLALTIHAHASIGTDNHNPGNIRSWHPNVWAGAVGVDRWHHLRFAADEDGIRAMRRVLRAYNHKGVRTVAGIVNRWVGPKHGTVAILAVRGYLLRVAKDMGTTGQIDLSDNEVMGRLAKSIIYAENGVQPYPESVFRKIFHY